MEIVSQLLINGLVSGSLYAIIAMGFNFLYAPSKVFNIAHASLIPLGGYLALSFVKIGAPFFISIVLAILCTGFCGVLIDRIVYLPLRRRKTSGLVLLIASLGVFTALQGLLELIFTSHYQSIPKPYEDHVFSIAGALITSTQLYSILLATVILIVLLLVLRYTDFGKKLRAVADDQEVSKIVGIDTERVIAIAFFIGSTLAGLAGVLIGLDIGLEPNMGMYWFLGGIIGAIIGTIGNITGGVVGSLIAGINENVGVWFLAGEWRSAVGYVLLILVLLFRPQGFFKR